MSEARWRAGLREVEAQFRRELRAEIVSEQRREKVTDKNRCYVFDLDGTLANLDHRLHFIKGEVKDWDSFFDACVDDTPIMPVVELFQSVVRDPHLSTVIVSGRSDYVRDQTSRWLRAYGITYDALFMREQGDHSPDYKCKSRILDRMLVQGWRPVLFIDDRKQVVDMWRSRGYVCLQCADGEF